jgi:hypothetical protein
MGVTDFMEEAGRQAERFVTKFTLECCFFAPQLVGDWHQATAGMHDRCLKFGKLRNLMI